MNIVEPIKSIEDIQNIKRILSKKPRNALLFSFGIISGLRITDILSLDVKDVKSKDYIELREKKTNKYKKFLINENLRLRLKNLSKTNPTTDLYFIRTIGQSPSLPNHKQSRQNGRD